MTSDTSTSERRGTINLVTGTGASSATSRSSAMKSALASLGGAFSSVDPAHLTRQLSPSEQPPAQSERDLLNELTVRLYNYLRSLPGNAFLPGEAWQFFEQSELLKKEESRNLGQAIGRISSSNVKGLDRTRLSTLIRYLGAARQDNVSDRRDLAEVFVRLAKTGHDADSVAALRSLALLADDGYVPALKELASRTNISRYRAEIGEAIDGITERSSNAHEGA